MAFMLIVRNSSDISIRRQTSNPATPTTSSSSLQQAHDIIVIILIIINMCLDTIINITRHPHRRQLIHITINITIIIIVVVIISHSYQHKTTANINNKNTWLQTKRPHKPAQQSTPSTTTLNNQCTHTSHTLIGQKQVMLAVAFSANGSSSRCSADVSMSLFSLLWWQLTVTLPFSKRSQCGCTC